VHILLIYGEGRVEEALLLSASPHSMRVLRREQADTMEFRNFEGRWVNESGGMVEIGAVSSLNVGTEDWDADQATARLRFGFGTDRFGHVLAN